MKVGWAEDTGRLRLLVVGFVKKSGVEENQTFTKALNLDARYLEEFKAGNFIYLQKKKGIDHTMYDLEVIEHFEVDGFFSWFESVMGMLRLILIVIIR